MRQQPDLSAKAQSREDASLTIGLLPRQKAAIMQPAKLIVCACVLLCASVLLPSARAQSSSPRRIVIAANVVFDGKGRVMRNTRIVIEGSKIVAIDPKAGPVDYDLRGLTVLPGWIDAHVHITWGFDKNGKNANDGATTQEAAYQAASNAWVTLMAGFTTAQHVGSAVYLRDA